MISDDIFFAWLDGELEGEELPQEPRGGVSVRHDAAFEPKLGGFTKTERGL